MGSCGRKRKKNTPARSFPGLPRYESAFPSDPMLGHRVHCGAWLELRVTFRPIRCTTKRAGASCGDSKVGVWGSGTHEAEIKKNATKKRSWVSTYGSAFP